MADVGCAGIMVLDTFCGPMRELPREGQLLAVDAIPTKAGGCAANVAIDLAKQGIAVDVAGCLGEDAAAGELRSALEGHGVGCGRVVGVPALPTSKTVILLVADQDRRYIHSFGANAGFTVGHIDRDWAARLKVFYLGGLFLMPQLQLDELVELLRHCRRNGVATVVDVVIPKNASLPRDLGPLLGAVDYFLPNEDEARQMTGLADPRDALRALLGMNASTVVVTRGKQGFIAGRGGEFWESGIYRMPEAVDPSGCGDAFSAGVVAGIVRGMDLPSTLRLAGALGASAARAVGTTDGVFSAAEAEEFVARNRLRIESGKL